LLNWAFKNLINNNSITKSMKSDKNTNNDDPKSFPGYPPYPAGEDIYNAADKIADVDSSDEIKKIIPLKDGEWNEKSYNDSLTGEDLDVPGSELDDAEEAIGSEDEENNYYSLGGDNHESSEEENTDLVN
jgi:hypothetical protein